MLLPARSFRTLLIGAFVLLAGLLSGQVRAHGPIAINGNAAEWMAGFGTSGCPALVGFDGDQFFSTSFGCTTSNAPGAEQIWSDNANDQRTDHWNGTGNLDLRQFRITMDRDNIYFLLRFTDITSCAAQNIQVAIASTAISSSNTALPDNMETNTSINWFRVVEASTSATGYWTDGVTFTSAGSSFCSTTNDLWEIAIPRSAMSMVNLSGTFSFSVAVACNTAGVPCEAPGSDVMDAMTTTGPNTSDEVGDGTLNFYTNPTLRDILCASYSYPYTMTSTAQSELVDAIQCANANGLSADVINFNGLTVSLIAATPFANYSGQTGLPQITSNISIRNGTIFHDMSGGGFLFRTFSIASGGTLNLQNMLLSGASAPTPGGAFHNSGTLNVTNSTMHGYDTSNRGGVLYNGSGASANFVNSLFYNNHAVFAHAMDNVGTVNIVNSTFDKHVSVGGFGAILEGTGYTVRNSILWNPGSGPTQISTGNTVSDSIVKGGYSGGTSILNTSPLFVDEGGNDFRIQLTSPAVNVGVNTHVPADTTDVDGDSNTAELRPDLDLNPRVVAGTVDMGAYERQDAGPPDPCLAFVFPYTLSGVDNTARVANLRQAIQCANANGSADTIDLNGQSVTMADSFADYSGATSLPQITSNISLQNGTLTRSGASLFRIISVSAAGSLTLRGTTISNGGGAGYASLGAGIHNLGTTTAINTNIVSNTGNLAVAIYSNNTLRVVNSTIAANFASSYSAILEMSGTATIANTLISGNRSTTSDNISINSGTLTVSNSTVAYNYTAVSANNASGAFYKFPSATLIVQNSIIWGNRNSNNSSDQIEVSSGSPTVSNSIIEGGIFGGINSDPLFVTPIAVLSTPTTAGDLQLNNFSPAIDAGANANVPVDTFDVDGDTNTAEEALDRALAPRRYNDTGVTDTGSGTAPIVDLGAYERQTNSDPCAAISFPYTLTGNTPVELRQAITCANANGTADVINLNGQTITLTDSFANYSGNTGLPQITTNITVRNGTITRSGANEFRFFNVSSTGALTVRDVVMTNAGGATFNNDGGTLISQGISSTLNVVNSTISGSQIGGLNNGSGIYSNASFSIVNSSVVGGGTGRGAIASGNGPVLIQNTLVAGNSGPSTVNGTGGVYLGSVASATIVNSTIVGNYTNTSVATQSGGIFASSGIVNLTIRNSIIWGNRNIGNTAPQVVNTTAGTNTVTSSLIEGGTFGALNSDPLFLSPITASATPTTAGNFQLGDLSPAVDAGANANVPVDTFDVDGDTNTAEEAPDRALAARRYNDTGVTDTGSGTAPIVDIGAYEKQTNSSVPADFTVTITATSISVNDSSNNGSTLAASEPAANTLRFDAAGRTFSVNGGALINGNSGDLALAGITSLTVTAAGGVSVASGTIFNIGASNFNASAPVTLAGGTLKSTGTATVNPAIVMTANSDLGATGGVMTLAGAISGDFTLRTFSAGTFRFASTASSFTRLQLAAGTATLAGNNTLPSAIDIFNSASLNLNGFSQSIDFYASSGTTQNTGAAATLTMGVAGSSSSFGSANYTGSISGPINLIIAAGAGQTLSSNSSSYTGTTDVLGTLAVAGDSALGAIGSGNGTTVAVTGLLDFRNVLYADNEAITVNGGTLSTSSGTSVFPGTIALQTSATSITLSNAASSLTLDGVVSGPQGFLKSGAGTLVLTQANTFVGPLTVSAGGLVITGSTAAASAVSINGGSLSGTGTIGGPLTVSNVGNLSPGINASTGILHTANVALASGSDFQLNVNGSTAGSQYDQLDVNGTINLTGADLFLVGAFAPAVGQSLMLIDNDGSDPVTGTFTGLPSNGTLTFNSVVLAIRYDGGDGNDVVLTAVPVVSIDVAPASVAEDGVTNLVYTVTRSASLPSATVVNITTAGSASSGSDYTGAVATATIAASATTTTITIDPTVDGTVEANETVILTLAAGSGYAVGAPPSATGTINNDDTAAIVVTPSSGLVTTEAGGTATFTVVLGSQPTGDVTIGLSSSDTTEGTVAPTSLVFTSGNWNVAQTVTVTGVDDLIVDGSVAYTINTAAATSSDSNYNGVDPANVGVSNSDNDTAGITVNPTTGLVTTEAGGTATFTVVLDSQPSADVSLGLSSSDTTEGTVAPTGLTFTSVNWNVAQTVTVTGVDDLIVDGSVAYTINTAAATSSDSNYNGVDPANVSVSNSDNDTAGITVSPTAGLVTTEAGGTATFTVVLNSQPSADVSMGLSSSDTTEGSVAPTSLLFTAGNWNVAQTVTVTGVDDLIVDGNVAYSIVTAPATSSDSNYSGLNASDVSVSNSDNDTAGITVSPTAGLVTTEAGGTATFTVVLNSQPSADVSMGLSSSDTTEGTVAPTSLVFTSGNWNVAQTVTVTGADDLIVDGSIAYSIVTAAATSGDANYNGFNPANVSVSNTDNDTAGATVSPTAGLVTTEAGGTATFTVVLNSQPSADVSIGLSSSDTTEGTVAPTSVVFTAANWNVAQTVTVTGVDDVIVDGSVAYTINTAAATSSDSNYNGVNPANVSVSNSDNDTAGITVSPTTGLVTTEVGGTATFTVVLNSQPSADVSVGLSSSDTTEGTVAPTSLLFTSGNWNVAQTVTVTGVDDVIVDGSIAYNIITAAAASADSNFNGVNAANVSVSNTDNDTAGITVSTTAGLVTTEAGATATFTVVLNSQPSADVSVGLSSSDTTEGSVAPTSLLFTAGNWNVAQTVTVTGVDDLIVDGAVAYSIITAPATSADSNYNGFNAANVSVSNTDNDNAGITVSPTAGLVTTEAGGTATFTVVLTSQPSADVSVGLSSSDTTEGTVAPTSLLFTAGNWNVAQTVSATGVDDLIVDGAVAYSIVTAPATSSDSNYNGVNPANVGVSNTDNDNAGITVSPTAGLVTTEAGGTATFTMVLNSQPSADVSVGLSSSDTTEGSVAPTSVVFTAANWNVAQTVTATGVDDVIVDGNIAYTIVTAPATSSDSNYNGVNPANVSVSNSDNDSAAVTAVQSGGTTTVTEGGATDSYTVALSSQPSGDVSIALTGNQVTTSPTSLTFTSVNWATAQTVTVTAIDDAIDEATPHAGSVTSVVTSGDANYNGSSVAPISVAISDNDTAGISVTPTSGLTTTEAGGTANFSVVLTSQPTGNVTIGLSSSDTTEGTVAPISLSFTAGNWNSAQTVTVTGVDDLIVDGNIAYTIVTAPAASSDANYGGVNPSDVSVSNSDNDSASITVVQSGGTTTVTEGGTTDSYTVVLSSQPASDVNIALSGTEVTTSPTSLVFTSANWATAQTVTVTAIDDAIDEATPHAGSVTSVVTSGDANYNGSSVAPVSVSITDNDAAGISVTPTSGLSTTEAGGTANFTVVLSSQPTGNVTIGLSSSDTTEGTVAPTSLSFTSVNWNIAQSATITGVDDALVDGAIAYSIVTAAATSSDSNYNGLNASDVSVSNSDNDNAGVNVAESGGGTAATEGGATDSYTVVLTSQPTSDVAVILGVGAQVSLSPSNLTFTAANWNVAQTVTVTATDDAVVEGPHNAAITHSTSSTDPNYSAIAVAGINVAITDNDSAVVNFAPASVSQTEATSPMAFTVTLSAPVASGVTLNVNSAFGTALAADFTPITGGTVSFAASSTTPQTVNVAITNDALDENDETFSLALSNLVATGNVTLGAASAAGTILDDDATPTLSITNQSQPEGNAGTSTMTFTVNLSAVSGRDVSFSRATVDGTATAGSDYVALAPQTLSILAGSTSLTIPVTINGDTTFEGNESFTVALTGISNATPASISGTGTLEEDDQQPTTTTITADTPDPTVVGQPYTVSVNVAAQTLSPTGTVTITDGSASCGPVTLTAATLPNSSASCALTSTTAGPKTLTASYTAATTAFGNSASVGTPHQVNAAATAISVVGPVRSRISQPTSFTFALSVNAPGAGSPTGTVTLTSGTATCNVTVPTATPSCALSFNTLGPRTITAAFAPSDGNFSASSSSGPGNAQTLVYALSDIAVTKTDAVGTYIPGDLLVYTVTVRNLGPDAAASIRVRDQVPAGVVNVDWTCDASGGVACTAASGNGNLDVTIASFPVGGLLNFTFFGNVSGTPAQIVNTALVDLPVDTTIEDPALGNNSASDTDVIDYLLRNGFEDPQVNAPSGNVRLSATRSVADEANVVLVLDDANGIGVRVYARSLDGQTQYALATRAAGVLRLGTWRSYPGAATLHWTARQTPVGWVLETAEIR